MKRQEIESRLAQIRKASGAAFDEDAIDLDEDYDPAKHEQAMQRVLGEDYDDAEEELGEEDLLNGGGEAWEAPGAAQDGGDDWAAGEEGWEAGDAAEEGWEAGDAAEEGADNEER